MVERFIRALDTNTTSIGDSAYLVNTRFNPHYGLNTESDGLQEFEKGVIGREQSGETACNEPSLLTNPESLRSSELQEGLASSREQSVTILIDMESTLTDRPKGDHFLREMNKWGRTGSE